MSFSPVGDHAAQIVLGIIERRQDEQITAANKIIAEQNAGLAKMHREVTELKAIIAKAHPALLWAFENLTTSGNVPGLKKITAALAEIEGRK